MACVLSTGRPFFCFLAFEVVVRQVADLVLILLLMVLTLVCAIVVNILTSNNVLRVLNIVLATRWVSSVL